MNPIESRAPRWHAVGRKLEMVALRLREQGLLKDADYIEGIRYDVAAIHGFIKVQVDAAKELVRCIASCQSELDRKEREGDE